MCSVRALPPEVPEELRTASRDRKDLSQARRPRGVWLVFPPTCSPWLNPTKLSWRHLRKQVLASHLCASIVHQQPSDRVRSNSNHE